MITRSPHGLRLWSLVCLLTLAAAPSLAQQAPKAGVVTGLQGQATVARATLPRPASLRFQDDVFFQDRVATERDSFVRLLLGGKALVTVRELSDFTVTEGPNRATVDLNVGRLALQLLRRLLGPGESIEIRTPNAIAAVRGSFVIVVAQIINGVLRVTIYALEITAPVTVTNLGTGQTATLTSDTAVTLDGVGAGTVMGPVVPIPPDQKQALLATIQLPRPDELTLQPPTELIQMIGSLGVGVAIQELANILGGSSAGAGAALGFAGGTTDTGLQLGNLQPRPSSTVDLGINEVNALVGTNVLASTGSMRTVQTGTFSLNLLPLISFSEGLFSYFGTPITQAVISFPSASIASRFALDNLTISGSFGTLTTTFSENPPGFAPVNGLTFNGVTYGFTLNGQPSTDANFGAFGPGSIKYVQDPSLEGNAAGILTLTFFQPVSQLSFGLARSTLEPLTPGAIIVLSNGAGSPMALQAFAGGRGGLPGHSAFKIKPLGRL